VTPAFQGEDRSAPCIDPAVSAQVRPKAPHCQADSPEKDFLVEHLGFDHRQQHLTEEAMRLVLVVVGQQRLALEVQHAAPILALEVQPHRAVHAAHPPAVPAAPVLPKPVEALPKEPARALLRHDVVASMTGAPFPARFVVGHHSAYRGCPMAWQARTWDR
jgi:hypothetical protein